MAESQEQNSRDYEINRQLTSLNRRIERLEDTQITGRELNRGFNRVYEEIDHLDNKVDHLDNKVDHLQLEFDKFRDEINPKLDTILKHITGIN